MKPRFAIYVLALAFALLSITISQAREMVDMQNVKLRSLDKITARTVTFDVKVGSTVTFGDLFIKVQSCRNNQPLDDPESAAFLQVWEGSDDQKSEPQWVFSGWMFASSPGLSYMDHPVYDVWVLECFNDEGAEVTPVVNTESDTEEAQEDSEKSDITDENEDGDLLLNNNEGSEESQSSE